jgi:hypothetical protein
MKLDMHVCQAARIIELLAFLTATAMIALHAPGHVSMDTSIQLYEASTGQSISWNPPFMSALLRYFGGGEVATAAIVFMSTVLIYGAYAFVGRTMARVRLDQGLPRVAAWRVVLSCVLVLNPIVMIYVGIVWKDVLFASFLAGATACGLAAGVGAWQQQYLAAALSVLLLAAALLTRQQGVFMAPILLFLPVIALASNARVRRLYAHGVAVFILFGILAVGLHSAASGAIRGADGRSVSQGFRSIMIFDMIGVVSRSSLDAGAFAYPITTAQVVAVRKVYDASRIDYIWRDPVAESWLEAASPGELRKAWWSLVKQNPMAYLTHRAAAFATLLGLRGVAWTYPVHIGVEGNPEYLKIAGVPEGRDARDQLVYRFASAFFNWPIYTHAFWLFALVVCAIAVKKARLLSYLKTSSTIVLAAVAAMFASFIPTMISSDFRYLFAVVPLISLVGMVLLLGARPPAAQGAPLQSNQ